MPDGEIPRYCVKCGRNYFARYDVIDAQIIIWCSSPKCHEMQHTIPIYGFHARPASQQRQVAEMVERTEAATNEPQGSEFLQVHLRLAEQNDTLIPCLAAGASGLLTASEATYMIGADPAQPEGDIVVQVLHMVSSLANIGAGNIPVCKPTIKPLTVSFNPSLEDLETLRQKVALLQRVRAGK